MNKCRNNNNNNKPESREALTCNAFLCCAILDMFLKWQIPPIFRFRSFIVQLVFPVYGMIQARAIHALSNQIALQFGICETNDHSNISLGTFSFLVPGVLPWMVSQPAQHYPLPDTPPPLQDSCLWVPIQREQVIPFSSTLALCICCQLFPSVLLLQPPSFIRLAPSSSPNR